jgi:hypothetical protein
MKFRLLFVLLLAVLGCSRQSSFSPLSPGPSPAPSPAPGRVLHEGVVYEVPPRGDPRPVPNLRLLAWEPIGLSRVGASRRPDVTTDESGRFSFLSQGSVVYLETAPGSPVKFICPSYPLSGSSDAWVVDASWSGDKAPQPTLSGFGSVSGTVTEHVGAVAQPVVGATVELDGGSHVPAGITNASGFYAICSPGGADFLVSITARKEAYRPMTVSILWGWDYDADFTLERN